MSARTRARGRPRPRRREPRRAGEAVDLLFEDELGRRGFSASVEREAAAAGERAERAAPGGRRDLTALTTFTVDPASARDFDDAVSAQREGDAIRVWVHIADVAAHVRIGSALDREAARRGNSTYGPGTVEPMLPRALSENACSLAPGVDRLAVTAEIELTPRGVAAASFYRSRIRSDARLDYDRLDAIFAGRVAPPEEIAEPLAAARAAAAGLADRRRGGALEVTTTEPEFHLDAAGDVVGAGRVAQTEAHGLIEQLMILTNEQVAELLQRRRAPTVYRVHGDPDPPRIALLLEQLADLEIPAPAAPRQMTAREAGRIAVEASRLVAREATRRGHGREAYTSLVLRAMQQARYSERNTGHAGLGSEAYCHFTSPIRRYPDLVAHRALLAALGEDEEAPSLGTARQAASHCSETERDSMRVEHRADDLCAAFLLARELGERGARAEFAGEVSGVVRSGVFVRFGGELGDVYEGFLPARLIGGDEFYELNRAETGLVGRRGGGAVRIGDPLAVRVTRVELERGRVDLEPVSG